MTSHRTPWPYAEALAHMDEVLELVANGEPQSITRPDGVTFVIHTAPPATSEVTDLREEPFVSAMTALRNIPRDEEFRLERLQDKPGDVEL